MKTPISAIRNRILQTYQHFVRVPAAGSTCALQCKYSASAHSHTKRGCGVNKCGNIGRRGIGSVLLVEYDEGAHMGIFHEAVWHFFARHNIVGCHHLVISVSPCALLADCVDAINRFR